ncbi:MAG: hypothetical protein KatS3mg087_0710 [Patescibacteria group bacterium]|nr:MAG: hypothetical protein KatS3mg087_0710 [Patescibacteria group bacterium]
MFAALLIASISYIVSSSKVTSQTSLAPDTSFAATSFLETFDGNPSKPEPFTQVGQNKWDIAIHSRNIDTWEKLTPMDMHHGPNCEAPLTDSATAPFTGAEIVTHKTNGTYENAVFKCKDHVMTSINGIGRSINDSYALVTMTPNQMVDFSQGIATIKFDMTTFRTTQRDWVDVWIMPWEDNLQLPFDSGDVDLQGMPKNAVVFRMISPNDNSKSGFAPSVIVNGKDTGEFREFTDDYNHFLAYEDYLPGKNGNPKRRDTFEIKISQNSLSICMPADPTDNAPSETNCWANRKIKTLPFTKGVVTFGHHSYTPNKDCQFYRPLTCGPNTWHWDNVSISPAIPFNMVKSDKRMVTNDTPVNFNSPAPANARLRFSAAGNVQLSFDGKAFQSFSKQPSSQPSNSHVASYFVPIPQGTTSVRFRLTESGVGGVHAKDFAIWSQDGVSTPSASTNRPTPVTSIQASAIASPSVRPSPSPIVSVSPSSSSSPRPTASPSRPPLPSTSLSPQPNSSGVTINGSPYFLLGANMPWYNWGCDFGCGNNGGVSSTRNTISSRVATLSNSGGRNIRWWLFPGDPWQIKNNTNPAPVNPTVYQDIDAALAIAQEHDIYHTFTLFSSATDIPRSWMQDSTQRNALVQNLVPLFNRYKDNKRIIAWQVFNEPEWQIYNNQVTEQEVVSFTETVNTAIKSTSSRWLVTIGSAMLDSLQIWKDSNLDFFTAHWYDYMNSGNWCATCRTAAQTRSTFGLNNRPIVIGEVYLGTDVNANNRLSQLKDNGYAGAYGWSLFGERTNDRMAIDLAGMKLFSQANASLIGPSNLPQPSSTVVAQPSVMPSSLSSTRPTPVPSSTPSDLKKVIIMAAGEEAQGVYPEIVVSQRDGDRWRILGSTEVRGSARNDIFEVYTFSYSGNINKGDLRIRFANDYFNQSTGEDRNVRIKSVQVENSSYSPLDPSIYSRGSWDQSTGCAAGYKKSEWLHCLNGIFIF